MKIFKRNIRLKKRHIIFGSIALFFALLLFFAPAIIRVWLVKNSENVIGRKVELEELHINYLRCSVDAIDFKMYEKNKVDTFVVFDELYVNFNPWRLLFNELSFSEIKLVKPVVTIEYRAKGFNFDDLLESDTTAVPEDHAEENSDTTKYVVRNFSISGGRIIYRDKEADTKLDMKNFGMNIPLISWNSNQSQLGVEFTLGKRGKVAVNGDINQKLAQYTIALKTSDIDLNPLSNYFKPYMDISSLQGLFYSDIKMKGDISNPTNVLVYGSAGIKNIDIKDPDKKDFFAASEVRARLDTLDVGKSNYKIASIEIDQPIVVATLLKTGTNFDKVFAPYFASDTATAEDSSELHYSIDSLIVNGGKLSFADLTLNRPFVYDLLNMDIVMTNYSDVSKSVPVTFSVNLNNNGEFKGKTTLDMVQTDNIDFDGTITGMDLMSLSPYSEYYVARPIRKGKFDYAIHIKMNPYKLTNTNQVKLTNLEFGKKTKDSTVYKVPVNLALYILKDRKGIIEFDLPVEGKPSDPNFKLRKIIWKALENFLIKTATQPFNALGKLVGTDPESIKTIPFSYLQDSLDNKQMQQMDKICEIIEKKPEIKFIINQTTDPEKEKSLLAIRDVKLRYVQNMGLVPPSADSSMLYSELASVKDDDKDFLLFLNQLAKSESSTLEEKCLNLCGDDKTDLLLDNLLNKRVTLLRNYFLNVKKILPGNILVKTADLRNLPEELKSPKFSLEVTLP